MEILANGTRKDARRLVALYNQGANAKVFDYNNKTKQIIVSPDISSNLNYYAEQIKSVIDSKNQTVLNSVSSDKSTIVGDAKTSKLDVADMEALNGAFAALHETIEQSFVQNPNWKSHDTSKVVKAHNQALQTEKNCRGISSPEYKNEINGDKTEFHIVDVATDESVDIFKIENGNIKK